MIEEVFDSREIKPAPYVFRRVFMAQEHNYYCAVCREEMAVIDTSTGVLQPCWSCQNRGYLVTFSWWRNFFRKKGSNG